MADYDAIVVGAGHNGPAAATVLAKEGLSVLFLVRTNGPGGVAVTRELFDGFKHNVGAWGLIVFRDEMMNAWNSRSTAWSLSGPAVRIAVAVTQETLRRLRTPIPPR